MKSKHLTVSERNTYRRLEDVVGCKWSAAIVAALGRGVHRPGRLERFIPGISTKVLTERLRRMLAYGLITRTEYSELPLRVEYHLTPVGEKLASVIEQLRALETELSHSTDRSFFSGDVPIAEIEDYWAKASSAMRTSPLQFLPNAASLP